MAASNMPQIWIDGTPAAGLSPLDRGLAYGDGVFETISVNRGALPLLAYHLQRLQRSAAELAIDLSDAALARAIEPIFAQLNSVSFGVIKIILTRGDGGRGYDPAGAERSRLICFYFPADAAIANEKEPCTVRLCKQRLGRNPTLAGHKHLSRIEQVIARAEWSDSAIAEGILCDSEGEVIEATSHNLFIWQDDTWLTPSLDQCGVKGVMRQLLCESIIPATGAKVREDSLRLEDIKAAEELFICNSVKGVRPVGEIVDDEGNLWFRLPSSDRAQQLQAAVNMYFEKAVN
ncbi:aminodeoxychorismate lyase [Gilvimarinus sp. DA14]|uniref:aminodeoxychorismate lyase n=1 Tax=Gilvimarinus sp. DA14 TaxID=2956798 RepID=UPI0020B80565|nr:aminodeoxychorismate lyase [Gilvimarinus sp. DA14]UTF60554.1 aminodeoxychorismate lyase [Gilvimarinus sp. DA14]